MNKVAQLGLRGSVKTMRTEFAEWGLSKEDWQTPRHTTLYQFRADAQINEHVSHNPNGTISRSTYSYDAADRLAEIHSRLDDGPLHRTVYRYDHLGRVVETMDFDGGDTQRQTAIWNYENTGRKTKLEFVRQLQGGTACSIAYGIEGTEKSYTAEDVATITTLFDDREHPSEALLHDSRGRLILQVTFTRDTARRLLREEARWPIMLASIEERMKDAPPEERAATVAAFAQILRAERVLSRTTYCYDDRGRRIERSVSMAGMSAEHTMWYYDDYDNPIRQIDERRVA